MRRGTVGSENFNKCLQAILNPSSEETIQGGRDFRVGDKVMQIRNNYDYDVFNGDIGRITDVDFIEKLVTIQFPEKRVAFDMADLNELVLAYGITVHKAQGSEYPAVVIPLMTQHYLMLQRESASIPALRGRRSWLSLLARRRHSAWRFGITRLLSGIVFLAERLRGVLG